MGNIGQQGTEEQISRTALYKNGREVLDVLVVEQVGAFFDIYPHKSMLWPFLRQAVEVGPVLPASVAPCRAIARDDKAVFSRQSVPQVWHVVLWIVYRHR